MDHLLSVARRMGRGNDFATATKARADEASVTEQTVRAACCRFCGAFADDWNDFGNGSPRAAGALQRKAIKAYRDFEDEIRVAFSP